MKTHQVQAILQILIHDANNLWERLFSRKQEYIKEFSLKRQRQHFKEIFINRYDQMDLADLKSLNLTVINTLNDFYQEVDKLRWYLNHTQDMQRTVESQVEMTLKLLKKKHAPLMEALNEQMNSFQDSTKGEEGEEGEEEFEDFEAMDFENEFGLEVGDEEIKGEGDELEEGPVEGKSKERTHSLGEEPAPPDLPKTPFE